MITGKKLAIGWIVAGICYGIGYFGTISPPLEILLPFLVAAGLYGVFGGVITIVWLCQGCKDLAL